MKAILTIMFIGIAAIPIGYAQSMRYPASLPYTGLSAYSREQADPLSFTANPGALAGVKQAGVAIFGERRFMLAATSAYRLAGVVPTPMGNFGLQLDYAGFKNFHEQTVGLCYARSLGPKIAVGIQFNYYGYGIPVYGTSSALTAEAGMVVQLSNKISWGMELYNPVGGKMGKGGTEKLAAVYRSGLGYDASENFFVSTELVKEEDMPVDVVAGFQYHFASKFFVRGGILTGTGTAYAGVGAGWGNLRVDLSAGYHPQLGFSPGLLLMTTF